VAYQQGGCSPHESSKQFLGAIGKFFGQQPAAKNVKLFVFIKQKWNSFHPARQSA